MSWCVWLTGPPAAGKSTLARALADFLRGRGMRVAVLESDALRRILTPAPAYTREERDRFYAALVDLATHLVSQGIPVVIDATGSRRAYRQRARRRVPRFLEVSVVTPPETREARDPKGLYRRARSGRAPNLPGLGAPYEEARRPDLELPGDGNASEGARRLLALLSERGFLVPWLDPLASWRAERGRDTLRGVGSRSRATPGRRPQEAPMLEGPYREIRNLLASEEADQVRRGLSLAREEIARVGTHEARPLFEMVTSLFYLDPLDRPDLLPVLDEAVNLVVGFGDWVVPVLVEQLDRGDLKAQMAAGHALGRIGADAIEPLAAQYAASEDPDRRSFIVYALGKIKSPELVRVLPLLVEAARSADLELRDTAVRAIGRVSASIPPERVTDEARQGLLDVLNAALADTSPGVRAKAVRSLGKLARFGHLKGPERDTLRAVCHSLAGDDEGFDWERAFVVRKEAEEALRYL